MSINLVFDDTDDLVVKMANLCNSNSIRSGTIAEGIEYILDNDLWQHREPEMLEPKEFTYFPEFCQATSPWGLNTSWDLITTVCQVEPRILHKVTEAGKRGHGGDRKSDKIKSDIVTLDRTHGSNSKAYGLSKLKKDRPDLFDKVTDKEMSVHAAMVKAGFRKRKIQVEPTPSKIARALKRHLDADQIAELIKLLMS